MPVLCQATFDAMLRVITNYEHYQFRRGLAEQDFLSWCAQPPPQRCITRDFGCPTLFTTGSSGTRGTSCPCATT